MRNALALLGALLLSTACETKVSSGGGKVQVTNAPGGTSASVDTPTTPTTPATPTTPTTPTTPATPATTDPGPATPAPAAGNPKVTRIQAVIKGAIDHDKVHAIATGLEPEILACYRGALERKPGYAGQIAIRFIVGAKGKIMSAGLTDPVPDGVFGECLTTAANKATFPKLSGGKTATITQPFTLAVE
jgi:hypothetical protein